MSSPQADGPMIPWWIGPERSKLRVAVGTVQAALDRSSAGVEAGAASELPQVVHAWRELVSLLALGAEPVMRACPHCGQTGMAAASRCGGCWSRLEPEAVPAA